LWVKEVLVNKGPQTKQLRIMGRGRTGMGYKRQSHITIKVQVIDFASKIANAESEIEKLHWQQIQNNANRWKDIRSKIKAIEK
jgi:hypothetical protein